MFVFNYINRFRKQNGNSNCTFFHINTEHNLYEKKKKYQQIFTMSKKRKANITKQKTINNTKQRKTNKQTRIVETQ